MKVFSKRRVVVVTAVIVLLLFSLRPSASRRLKSRIAGAISAAVARPVEIGSVHIRLLPQPGFDLLGPGGAPVQEVDVVPALEHVGDEAVPRGAGRGRAAGS